MSVTTSVDLNLLVLALQERVAAAGATDALVILRPSELARLIGEARTQGYERGRDALGDAIAESMRSIKQGSVVPADFLNPHCDFEVLS